MFSLNPEKINFDEGIGSGTSGIVYPYQSSAADDRWVVKRVMTPVVATVLQYINEIVLGFSCDHPNVLPVKGYHIDFDNKQKSFNIYMKMPRMMENIKDKITRHAKNNSPIPEKELINYFYSLTCGLAYLHNKKIAHRDIKPDNILIDKNGQVKIGDIGAGRLIEDESLYLASDRAGAILYTAPEILQNSKKLKKKNLYKADVWSLGMVIAELCVLKTKLIDVFSAAEKKEADLARKLKEAKSNYSPELIDLILGLLRSDPEERMSVQDIKQSLEEKYSDLIESIEEYQKEEIVEKEPEEKKVNPVPQERLKSAKAERPMSSVERPKSSVKEKKIPTPEPEPEVDICQIKDNLDKLWGDTFNIELTEAQNGLAIIPINPPSLNDSNVRDLMDDFKNYKEAFEQLIVNFEGCASLTDNAVKEAAKRIGSNCKNLLHLEFNLFECNKITDASVKELFKQIGANLQNLEYLDFYVPRCPNISDDSVKEIAKQIGPNLSNLQHLELNFGRCLKISDIGLKELARQIGANLYNLDHLLINLGGCKTLTDESIKELGRQIGPNAANLQSLILIFAECNKITDIGAKEIAKQIKLNLKKLSHLSLILVGCTSITNQAKASLKDTFKNIPELVLEF